MIEQQMWLATVWGNNKGPVFDLSFEAYVSSCTVTSPSPPPPTQSSPQPNSVMEDCISRLETMIAMRDMRASSSSQPTASTRAPAPR
ncbi:UNVERIFIED_CONTAM: hypothetical protein Sindi_0656900 [Sesamum indicum]